MNFIREVRRQMAAMYQIISQPSKIDTSAFFKYDKDRHNDSE